MFNANSFRLLPPSLPPPSLLPSLLPPSLLPSLPPSLSPSLHSSLSPSPLPPSSTADIPGLAEVKKEEDNGEEDDDEDMNGGGISADSARNSASVSAGTKRKHDKSQSESSTLAPPTKRSKPVCKYGPKCYQKGHQHREQFEHPWVSI